MRHPKVAYTPEPCAPVVLAGREQARAAYGIRANTCVVTVFGFLDHRKCIAALLDGASRVPPEVDLTVMLAGPQHLDMRRTIRAHAAANVLRQADRLIEVDRFILNDVDPDPLAAADISWVFYDANFVYSSSVLMRSAMARRPVIARHQGVVGRQVEQNGMGIALPDENPDVIAAALTRLAQDPALRDAMGYRGFEAFFRTKPADFARPIVDAVKQATQPPPATRKPPPAVAVQAARRSANA